MYSRANKKGNVTALVVVLIGVVVVLLAFFFLNFNQLFGTHKEAQTAIDGAALQAAKDISKIVISGSFGQVGLMDDTPGTGTPDGRPVWGLNTLMATTRLDALIANALGNTTMEYAISNDIGRAQADAKLLATAINNAINGQTVNDKNGNPINLVANANAAYDANSRRLGKGKRVGSVVISAAQLPAGQGETNIPVPAGTSLDQSAFSVSVNGQTVYKPYVSISTTVNGTPFNFMFAAYGNEPQLVASDPASLLPLTAPVAPSVIKVEATEEVTSVAPSAKPGEMTTTKIKVASGAQAGGVRVTNGSGVFCLAFPQGFPPTNGGINFAAQSPLSLMNLSQLPPGSSSSPFTGWNPAGASAAHWLSPQGGPYPSATGSLTPSNYMGLTNTDPSVTLALMTYDWIQAMGLRDNNVNDVVNALKLANQTFGQVPTTPSTINSVGGVPWMQPVYAQSAPENVRVGAYFGMSADPTQDPRYISPANVAQNGQQAYNTQYYSSFGYTPALTNMPANASVTNIDATTGLTTTASKAPVQDIPDMWVNGFAVPLQIAAATIQAAQSALDPTNQSSPIAAAKAAITADQADLATQNQQLQTLQGQLAAADPNSNPSPAAIQSSISAVQAKIAADNTDIANQTASMKALTDRANNVIANGNHVTATINAIMSNMQALSAIGLTKDTNAPPTGPFHYVLGGADFYPPTKGASTSDVIGTGPIPAGQLSGFQGSNDWASSVVVFKYSNPAIAHHHKDGNYLLQPALAQSSVPSSQVSMYLFSSLGDASQPGASSTSGIAISTPFVSPFLKEAVLEGQELYQNTIAYTYKDPPYTLHTTTVTSVGNSATGITITTTNTATTYQVVHFWQVYARSENANTVASNQPGGGDYFGNTNAPGYFVQPTAWCHGGQFTVANANSAMQTGTYGNVAGGSATAVACPNMISEWQIRCPIQHTDILDQTSTSTVQWIPPDPPPPPMMG